MKNNDSALAAKQKDDSDTALSYDSIGNTQHEMKDYKSALESHQHALQIRLKLFGEDHCDTALSYNNIGVIHCYNNIGVRIGVTSTCSSNQIKTVWRIPF
jgi:hypothetical protein